MKTEYLRSNTQYLLFQRNIFLVISILLSIAVILLSTFLFLKRERVIVTPPVVQKEFWVDARSVSPSYLEQQASFFSQLLLTKDFQSAASKREILLRNTDSAFIGALKKKLVEEERTLKEQSGSYVFFPSEVNVDPKSMSVTLTGDRVYYLSDRPISKERESYTLSFSLNGSRLLLKSISSKEIGDD